MLWQFKPTLIENSAICLTDIMESIYIELQSHENFQRRATEESFLIYNYKSHYVGKMGLDWTFQEAYLF